MTYTIATHKETAETRLFRVNPTYNVMQIWDGKKWENYGLFSWYYKVTGYLRVKDGTPPQ